MKSFFSLLVFAFSAISVSAEPRSNAHGVCGVLQDASLLNLNLLGCPHIGVGGRVRPAKTPISHKAVCAAFKAAELSNLDKFGCGEAVKKERGDGGLSSELCSHPSNPCGHEGSPAPEPSPSPQPWPHPHPKPWPQPRPQPKVPEHRPSPGKCDQPAPKCSTEELCEVVQHGLINIDILGCAKIDVGGHKTPAAPCCEGCNACDHDKACKVQACKILQQGGLLNLDLLGCAEVHL